MKQTAKPLKPCPFCGGNDLMDGGEVYKWDFLNHRGEIRKGRCNIKYSVRCRGCGAEMALCEPGVKQNADPRIAQAIVYKKWNTRAK